MIVDGVNKTLYIPLYGKAFVSRKGLFFRDEMAEKIWEAEGFPLKGKAKSRWLSYYMAMRAKVFDLWLEKKLEENPGAVVLHPGCGMDSRVLRVNHPGHRWFDVDFPEVIAERKKYFSEGNTDSMVTGDLRDTDWLDFLPGGTALVVMEGVSMYLKAPELQTFLQALTNHFEKVFLLVDVYTALGAKATKYKNPIHTVGVTEVFGVDDPLVLTTATSLTFRQEHSMTPDGLIATLPKKDRGIFRYLFAGGFAQKLYRMYEYEKLPLV